MPQFILQTTLNQASISFGGAEMETQYVKDIS